MSESRGWDWDAALAAMPGRWTRPADDLRAFAEDLRRRDLLRVYDLGCGVGRHTVLFSGLGFDVVASDVSPSAIEHTREALAQADLEAQLLQQDMNDWPFADQSLDAVVAVNVVYHATREQLEKILRQIHRCLVPGGSLYITFKSRDDSEYGTGIELAPHTFAPDSGIEAGIPHYYVDGADVETLLHGFLVESSEHRVEQPTAKDDSRIRAHWRVIAHKPE